MYQYAGGWLTKEQQLMEAAEKNNRHELKRLLKLRADPNWRDKGGSSALHKACQHKLDAAESVEALLEAGAEANAADTDHWRPLHWAAFYDTECAVMPLLRRSADVNAQNGRKETALHWACRNDSARVARALLGSQELDLASRANDGETAMDWAQRSESPRVLKEFEAAQAARGSRAGSV